MTEMLGWTPEELMGHAYAEIVHPEDEVRFTKLLADCRSGAETSSSLAYRSRKKDGSYLWLEANVRLFLDEQSGKPAGFVYVLRDISLRKAAEQELQQAFHTAQRLALVDGLTGVANRRLLDETLQREWARAVRDQTPLSLLLIDVDCFKTFNDLYGHLAGDDCLRRIAKAIQKVLKRPQDLLARYGGEEFVVVLPNTQSHGAELLSERIRDVIEQCAIPHGDSPHRVVTVSVGCATTVPAAHVPVNSLLKTADAALYMAKAGGRNRMQAAGVVLEVE